ncbi:hypothetical protein O3P69_005952 [Scylla paramamosain]|uniref:BolA-like protein 3 n=1 Tax=Scylla paramamosain TaxID=85552 RepID=A0AAW0U434_SCYPA
MTLPCLRRLLLSTLRPQVRWLCESAGPGSTRLVTLLKERFPQATAVEVEDISGGCGAMYEVWVEAPDFKGLSRVKQHKLITEVTICGPCHSFQAALSSLSLESSFVTNKCGTEDYFM